MLERTEESGVRPPIYIVSLQWEQHRIFTFGSRVGIRVGIRVGVGVTNLFHLLDFQEIPGWKSIIPMQYRICVRNLMESFNN